MTMATRTSEALNAVLDPQWLAGYGRLGQSIRLEEKGPDRFAVTAIKILAAAIAFFIVWAAITKVSEIAPASGEVTPVGSVKRVQHLEGGIVAAVHVRDGDYVAKNQVLIDLEAGATGPELDRLRTRLASLELQQTQLEAMAQGKDIQVQAKDARFSQLADAQDALLTKKQQQLESKEAILRQQWQGSRAGLASVAGKAAATRREVAILNEQVDVYDRLVKSGIVGRMLLLDRQRSLMQAKGQLAELDGEAAKSREAVVEAQARIDELHATNERDATEELGKVKSDLAELRETVVASRDRAGRLSIRAPVAGVVNGLQAQTVGGVIAPGATVLEIIPSDAPLIVEARVLPRDIGFVHDGQDVLVKVTTFDYTRFGGIKGKIENISATTFQDEKGNFFYRARIKLAKNHVGGDPKRNLIIPGMTVLADIHTGGKSVLAYLLKPLVGASDDALHER